MRFSSQPEFPPNLDGAESHWPGVAPGKVGQAPWFPLLALALLLLARIHLLVGFSMLGAACVLAEALYLIRHGLPHGRAPVVALCWLLVLTRACNAGLDPFESGLRLCWWILAATIFTGIVARVREDETRCHVAGFASMLAAAYCLLQIALAFRRGSLLLDPDLCLFSFPAFLLSRGLPAELKSRFGLPLAWILIVSTILSSGYPLLAGMTTVGLVWLADRGQGRSRAFMVACMVTPALLILFGLLPQADRGGGNSLAVRKDVLKQVVGHAFQLRWVGQGAGSFGEVYQSLRDGNLTGEGAGGTASNSFVEMFVESGWPGLALWAALLYQCLRRVARGSGKPMEPFFVVASAFAGSALMVTSGYNQPACLGWLALLGGLAVAGSDRKRRAGQSGGWVWAFVLLSLPASLWILYRIPTYALAVRTLDQSQASLNDLQLEQALARAESSIRVTPNWWRPRWQKAQVLLLMGAGRKDTSLAKQAIAELRRSEECSRRKLSIRQCLARAYSEAGQPEKAVEVDLETAQMAPYHCGVLLDLLQASALCGDLPQCQKAALQLCGNSPAYARVASIPLLAAYLQGQDDQLRSLLVEAALPRDSFNELKKEYESQTRRLGLKGALLPFYDAWLDLNPTSLETRLDRVRCLEQLGQSRLAYDELQPLREEQPDNQQILASWAPLAVRFGDPPAALQTIEAAVKAQPASLPLTTARVRCYLEANRLAEARERVDSALETWGSNVPLNLLKARILLASGARDGARESLLYVLQLDAGNEEANQLLLKSGLIP